MLGKSIDDTEKKVVQTIDDKVFEYRIAKDLKQKVNEHVAIAVANNVESPATIKYIEKLIQKKTEDIVKEVKEEIHDSVAEIVIQQIDTINDLDTEKLIKKYLIPHGAVLPFNTKSCPTGWSEYTKAYGKFIRGIDKSGNFHDPDGIRSPGSTQTDSIMEHSHEIKSGRQVPRDPSRWLDPNKHGGKVESLVSDVTTYLDTSTYGNAETRPKNIALLFCEKI